MTDTQDPVAAKEGSSPKATSPKGASPKSNSSKGQGSSPAGPPDPVTGLLPGGHWTQVAAEQVIDDGDSAVGTVNTASTSLASSILEYRTLHGRTFHSDQGNAKYWMSNDDTANEALDITHHVLTMMLDSKLHLAPLDKNTLQNAVDIGTGTGIWAMDFADEYPNCNVIGTDISPIQPSWVPPNLQFQIDDCTQPWTYDPGSLDYVHMRWLVGSVADWTALMRDAFRCLKPGAYIESHEGSPNLTSDDGTVTETSAVAQWGKLFRSGGDKIGRPFTLIEDGVVRRAMEEAGFVDVSVRNYKCPIGGWARDKKMAEMGEYMRLAFEQDAEGAVLFMADLQGWTREEIMVYNAMLRSELRDKNKHAYFPSQVIYARKPAEEETK